jgi:hypothetical protein
MIPLRPNLPPSPQPVYVRATAPLPAEENAAQLWTFDRGYLVNKRTAYGMPYDVIGRIGAGGYHTIVCLHSVFLKVLGIKNGTVFPSETCQQPQRHLEKKKKGLIA